MAVDIECKNIAKFVNLLEKQFELENRLSLINDNLINLMVVMSEEDVKKARKIFESETGEL